MRDVSSCQDSCRHYDVVVLGAGASGLMCAITAGYRGLRVLLLDHAPKVGAKIRIAGGGKCNFTNRDITSAHYACQNPHFVKSALSRYPAQAFIDWVDRHQIAVEERAYGQLFCANHAGELVAMLRTEADWAGVEIQLSCTLNHLTWHESSACYHVDTSIGMLHSPALVVATGGLSYPKLKASALGYRIAQQFGLAVIPPHPGLVGLKIDLPHWAELAGISLPVTIRYQAHHWQRDLLFTHKGISGPAVLMVSNRWQLGDGITIDLLPNVSVYDEIQLLKQRNKSLKAWFRSQLPKRLADFYWQFFPLEGSLAELSDHALLTWATGVHHWQLMPTGTEGYAKAEVTLGGVDTDEISSKTFEAKRQHGLYFIGEVLDVTGDLGGYNLHWAWASGFACGSEIPDKN